VACPGEKIKEMMIKDAGTGDRRAGHKKTEELKRRDLEKGGGEQGSKKK